MCLAKKKALVVGNTYSPYSINNFNENFYKKTDEKLINKLPNLFTKLDLFNVSLHSYITKKLNQKNINLIELASGKKIDRWEVFKEIDKNHTWKILLTDFAKHLLPKIKNTATFKFKTKTYSLFNAFSKLKQNQKYDVMLSTYTFDNLWLEGDLHLTKIKKLVALLLRQFLFSLRDVSFTQLLYR